MSFPWQKALACTVLLACSASSSAATIDEAQELVVHLDHMRREHMKQYADARAEWVRFTSRRRLPDPWGGTVLEIEGQGFYTLRPFGRASDLATSKPQMPADAEYAAAVQRYNERSDGVLIFPHTNQVWSRHAELYFLPKQNAPLLSGKCSGTLTFDSVEPLLVDDYHAAWAKIHEALARIDHPATHAVFSMRYGDGRMVSIWIGSSAEAFRRLSLNTALVDGASAMEAAQWLGTLRKATRASETHAITCRPDLSD